MAHHELIEEAFSGNVELAKQVLNAMRDNPAQALLYVEIAKHIRLLQSNLTTIGAQGLGATEPSPKKRKLQNGTALNGEQSLPGHKQKVIFEAKDLSFSIPIRKKLHLEIAQDVTPAAGHSPPTYQVRMRNPASGDLEYRVGMQSFKHALRLPVPEKAQKQINFVLLPEFGLGIGDGTPMNEAESQEPLVWTVGEGPQKIITSTEYDLREATQLYNGGLIEKTIQKCLEKTSAGSLVQPDEAEFASATREAHRKGEKSYHVKAFRGSKDGYLFFLATGIFFGFKKPLAFFPFEAIHSVSYTSVLQRTFNLNIAVQVLDQDAIKEHEFAMLDQADFAGIDAYIKRHGLQDASLAESRKAKKLNLSDNKKGTDEGGIDVAEQQSELHKAQQSIEDAEDEEEEDYDPGSGLSDGSGESSEEEEDEDRDVGEIDKDIVAEELGSEAEEVVPDPEDNDQL